MLISLSKGYKTAGINQSPNFPTNRLYNTEESLNNEIGYYLSNNKIFFKSSTMTPYLRFFSNNFHRTRSEECNRASIPIDLVFKIQVGVF